MRFSRIENLEGSKHFLVVIGTKLLTYRDFGEFFWKVKMWYLKVSIDVFIDCNHLKTIWIWFWAFKLSLEPKSFGVINHKSLGEINPPPLNRNRWSMAIGLSTLVNCTACRPGCLKTTFRRGPCNPIPSDRNPATQPLPPPLRQKKFQNI